MRHSCIKSDFASPIFNDFFMTNARQKLETLREEICH